MRKIVYVLFLLMITTGALAQDNEPFGELEPISPENIARIQELAHISDASPEGLVWSPDGDMLALETSTDVRLYDLTAPNELPLMPVNTYGTGHRFDATGDLLFSAFSAWDTRNGERIWSSLWKLSPSGRWGVGSGENSPFFEDSGVETIVELWDVQNLTVPVYTLRTGITVPLNIYLGGALFSPDEHTLTLLFSPEYTDYHRNVPIIVQQWDTQSGERISTFEIEQGGSVLFSPDMTWLVSNTTDHEQHPEPIFPGEVTIWDMRTGETLATMDSVDDKMTVSPDNAMLAVALMSGEIMVWSREQQIILGDPDDPIRPLKFSPDGRLLGVIDSDQKIGLWNLTQHTKVRLDSATMPDAGLYLQDIFFSPDSRYVVTRDQNDCFRLWDATTGDHLIEFGQVEHGQSAFFSPDGSMLALSRAMNYRVIASLWDLSDPVRIQGTHFHSSALAQVDPTWTQIAYWDYATGDVQVVNLENDQITTLDVVPGYLGRIDKFRPQHELAVFRKDDNSVVVRDLRSGSVIASYPQPILVNTLLSADSRYLMVSTQIDWVSRHLIMIYDLESEVPTQVTAAIECDTWGSNLQFSPHNTYFAIRDSDFIELWDPADGTLFAAWNVPERLTGYRFSPDEKWLVTTDYYGEVLIWDIDATLEQARLNETRQVDGVVRLNLDLSAFGRCQTHAFFSANGGEMAIETEGVSDTNACQVGMLIVDVADLLASDQAIVRLTPENTPFYADYQADSDSFRAEDHLLRITDLWGTKTITEVELPFLADSIVGVWTGLDNVTFDADALLLAQRLDDNRIAWWDMRTLQTGDADPLFIQPMDGWGKIGFNYDQTLMFVSTQSGVHVWGIPARN